MQKVSSLLNAKKDDGELTESDIIGSLNTSNEQTRKKLQTNIEDINKLLQKYKNEVNEYTNYASIWKPADVFKFSSTLKHPDIKILSDHLVTSANNSGYKFVIMEPHL